MYYVWSKEFLEAGKRRVAGGTSRAATTDEVKDLRRDAVALKGVVAEQTLELRLLKKSMIEAVVESPVPPTISAWPTYGVLIPLGQAI
jgi:hypothetical protein